MAFILLLITSPLKCVFATYLVSRLFDAYLGSLVYSADVGTIRGSNPLSCRCRHCTGRILRRASARYSAGRTIWLIHQNYSS